jgi:hypothetical protein
MSIAYYPLEPDDVPPPPPDHVKVLPPPQPQMFKNETTECNYLVLFFVVGVLFLALTDSMKK